MPNSALRFSSASKPRRERKAQRRLSSIEARATGSVAGYGVHSSKIIAMSESSTCWMRIDSSGLRKTFEPSTGEAKVTPSSVILRLCASEKTWNPPESVRIGRFQPMNRCRPPKSPITSRPGRRNRWKVLPRIISAPISSTSRGVIALTVP